MTYPAQGWRTGVSKAQEAPGPVTLRLRSGLTQSPHNHAFDLSPATSLATPHHHRRLASGMGSRRDARGKYTQLGSKDAIVSRLAQQDNVPWHRKPNLRLLYLLMFPACLGVEMAFGYVD